MDISLKVPSYAKAALIFISAFAFVFTMYLGQSIIVPIVFATIITIATKDSIIYNTLTFAVHLIIQFITTHFYYSKNIASRVKISTLISVIIILIGGTLWGIASMFLSIPLTTILKVILDHNGPLKPREFLFGNMAPTTLKYFLKNVNNNSHDTPITSLITIQL